MENIFLGILFGITLISSIGLLIITIRLAFISSEMATIIKSIYVSVNKIEQMSQATMNASEHFVDSLEKIATEPPAPPAGFFKVFRSDDGRHYANSFEELMKKIRNDPNYNKMSDRDIEELRKLFEENSSDDNNDEENDKPWEK